MEPLTQWFRKEHEPRLKPGQQFADLTQHGTCYQWVKWLGEQVSGVADRMEDEQQQAGVKTERLLATTEELEKAPQIWSLEEELKRAKEYAVIMANMGQQSVVTATD